MSTTPAVAAKSEAALDTMIDLVQLRKDVDINSANIIQSLAEHAGLYLHYAVIAVRARRQHERWKSAQEVLESRLNSDWRTTLTNEYEAAVVADPKAKIKPPTEAQVRAAVVNDVRWKKVSAQVIDAQEVFKLAEAAENAMAQRKTMLEQISRLAGREQDGPLRVQANIGAKTSRDDIMAAMRANAGKGALAAAAGETEVTETA